MECSAGKKCKQTYTAITEYIPPKSLSRKSSALFTIKQAIVAVHNVDNEERIAIRGRNDAGLLRSAAACYPPI